MIHEAFKIHQDDIGHIPLHQQSLAWGVKKNIDTGAAARQRACSWKYITVKEVTPRHDGGLASDRAWRQRCRPQLPHLAGGGRRGADRVRVHVLRGLRRSWVAPHHPFDLATLELGDAFLPPSGCEGGKAKYLLGTDDQGRDILSALMYGARISLLVGIASVVLSVLVGVMLGLLAGFVRRLARRLHHARVRRDALVSRHPDRAADRRRRPRAVSRTRTTSVAFGVLIIAISLTGWVQYARTVRGSTLVERSKEYVQAARVTGVAPLRIMRRHVLPNILGPVMVLATIQVGHGDHHRGHAVVPGRGRAAQLAFARHADPGRQQVPVLRQLVDHGVPRARCWC